MIRKTTRRTILSLILVCSVGLSFVFGADFQKPEYVAAVQVTAEPLTESRIDKSLWGLDESSDTHGLRFDSEGRVLMATWTGSEYYDGKEGQAYVLEPAYSVWLVPARQVKTFFNSSGRIFSVPRLEQAYGLPAESGYSRMVTMWVHPADLVRPCPDSDVMDGECETTFPAGESAEYKTWFTDRRDTIYDCDTRDCYPWTGLGYTYDWGTDATDNHVGFSEYIKLKGSTATVIIEAVQSTEKFFAPPISGVNLLLLSNRCDEKAPFAQGNYQSVNK